MCFPNPQMNVQNFGHKSGSLRNENASPCSDTCQDTCQEREHIGLDFSCSFRSVHTFPYLVHTVLLSIYDISFSLIQSFPNFYVTLYFFSFKSNILLICREFRTMCLDLIHLIPSLNSSPTHSHLPAFFFLRKYFMLSCINCPDS